MSRTVITTNTETELRLRPGLRPESEAESEAKSKVQVWDPARSMVGPGLRLILRFLMRPL